MLALKFVSRGAHGYDYRLSMRPTVGGRGLEPPTSRMSTVRVYLVTVERMEMQF